MAAHTQQISLLLQFKLCAYFKNFIIFYAHSSFTRSAYLTQPLFLLVYFFFVCRCIFSADPANPTTLLVARMFCDVACLQRVAGKQITIAATTSCRNSELPVTTSVLNNNNNSENNNLYEYMCKGMCALTRATTKTAATISVYHSTC